MLNLGSLLEPETVLMDIIGIKTKVIISVVLELILAVSVVGIGFLLFPILKKKHEGLATGYVVFRMIESILIITATVSLISLLSVGQESDVSSLSSDHFIPVVNALISVREWSFAIGTMIFLGLGGLFLNYILLRGKMAPGWLSV
jgi:hypothetical protein